jgi:hypothetical protein
VPNPRNAARERMLAARNREIRRLAREEGQTPKQLAQLFNLDRTRIYQIIHEPDVADLAKSE